jgi:hypothetical protein
MPTLLLTLAHNISTWVARSQKSGRRSDHANPRNFQEILSANARILPPLYANGATALFRDATEDRRIGASPRARNNR